MTDAAHLQSLNDLPSYLSGQGFGEVHVKYDPATELLAIITIHNDKFQPAIGGCRCIEYSSFAAAMQDAFQLAQGMSHKTAASNLSWGGAKAVLVKPKLIRDRQAYFKAFAQFVHELGGRYITSIDSGTELSDLDTIAKYTPYVIGMASHLGADTDPSLATALGVCHGIEAAVNFKLGKTSLAGLTIAVQGVGHVGYQLCKQLYSRGVKLVVTDADTTAVARCVKEFTAQAVAPEDIYSTDCDVFSPCALGGILNIHSIAKLKASIIAGAANNQLAEESVAELLTQADILYAPDYVINAGGVILATALYEQKSLTETMSQLQMISDNLLTIFARAQKQNVSSHTIAAQMVKERLGR
jgi:leucine dehydrogenase